MGCGASSPSTGRESYDTISKEAKESFFPKQYATETAPVVVTPQKTPAVIERNGIVHLPEQKLSTPRSSPTKKTSYVPPSPILATEPLKDLPVINAPPVFDDPKTTSPVKKTKAVVADDPSLASFASSSIIPPPPPPVDSPGSISLDFDELTSATGDAATFVGDDLEGSLVIGEAAVPKKDDHQGSLPYLTDNLVDSQALDVGSDYIDPEAVISGTEGLDFSDPDTMAPDSPAQADKTRPFIPYSVPINADATPVPSSESGMRFDELYRLKGVLGTGAFSTVRTGFHRSNGDISYAVKCINRKKLSEEDEAALLDEVGILKEMSHAHIIRLYDFFEEPSTYYLIMERMRGGELFDRIVAKAYYNEKEARDTCRIVLQAVGYFHERHVAHRDLKPENLLLLSEDDDSAVKIADFGFAKRVFELNSLKTQCGTPGYVAPEILEGTPYDHRADMWSVGVILYILLGGYPPFIESTQRDLFRKIRKGEYEFHEEYWGTVSEEAKTLISSLLTVNASERMTAQQAMDNPWIQGDDSKLAKNDLGGNLQKLRNFNGKRKFRAAVATIMAVNKLNVLGASFFSKPSELSDDNDEQQEA